jgi:UDP-N-acetylmuramoyl-L-alanyl-D-glutamate--2,6-diaminopimelate ligase
MFNVYNSLFAIAAARLENISWEHINKVLADTQVVAGRFEVVQEGNSPMCIVDYAHSPDGLMNVLKGARALMLGKSDSKLICLFGCGGDRDMTKRPKMGRIAAEMADKVIVTSDNPRSEEPEQIIADILTGIHDMSKVTVIADRKAAIQAAVKTASSKDLVVIAGKGHEDYQILKDKTIHFDDREEVRAAIKN